jgi:PHD/YefM family antitoxin component YafN of YafNO toxin-antitoxin module
MSVYLYRLGSTMEKTLSITSARSQLLKLSKQVARHMDRYVLTNKGQAETVLLSVGEYKGLRAAAELAAHPEVIAATVQGFEQLSRGEGMTLEEAFPAQSQRRSAGTKSDLPSRAKAGTGIAKRAAFRHKAKAAATGR